MAKFNRISRLNEAIIQCKACQPVLPFLPQPMLQINAQAKILIIGQAPSLTVHETKKLWNDASGKRLIDWLGINFDVLYDKTKIAIVPMGFCYPGKARSGDLPPRKECAPLWHQHILRCLKNVELTILVGNYAQTYFLGHARKKTLTETVKNWRDYTPQYFPLPHPSPRNNIWLSKNFWFLEDIIPNLQAVIRNVFSCHQKR